ncbi:MAG: translation initiation factor IF-2 N-terminal domain-containing protein, partial [Acidobacteriia bacterium]|nr:translation initiation factor IF-2 N-terminal domain-containing protein [Terriglobia bacterium]
MKKIRINELARELEVKAHEILERLPELGVQEKKTHSSSIDEDVAIKLRRYYGFDVPDAVEEEAEGSVAVATEEGPERPDQEDEGLAARLVTRPQPHPDRPAAEAVRPPASEEKASGAPPATV